MLTYPELAHCMTLIEARARQCREMAAMATEMSKPQVALPGRPVPGPKEIEGVNHAVNAALSDVINLSERMKSAIKGQPEEPKPDLKLATG